MSISGQGASKQVTKPDTTTGDTTMEPRGNGLVSTVTSLFESIGVLNKGSSDSAATPKADDAAQTAGISSNALNVTRVGGLTALIASAGAAALAIFNVHKGVDQASVVVAAYVSVESLLQKLVNDDAPTDAKKADTITRITSVFNIMDQRLPWPN